MQPVPNPEHDHLNWVLGGNLVTKEIALEFLRRFQSQKPLDLADLTAGKQLPTLLHLLAEAGHITAAQRDDGLAVVARQRAEFMNWRSQTMADEQRKRNQLPGGPPPPQP